MSLRLPRPLLRFARRLNLSLVLLGALLLCLLPRALPSAAPAPLKAAPVEISTPFEGASLGTIEPLPNHTFRLQVTGQANAEGRNRQPTWYAFRIDHARDRDLTLVLHGFQGEYNGKPACPMSERLRPVQSSDGQHWTHLEHLEWNDQTKEATLRLRPSADTVFIAHVPPYPTSRLNQLLAELEGNPFLQDHPLGSSIEGRPLHQLTVTDSSIPPERKKCVWLQSRQHAWEASTSWVMEGALRFITSEHPQAQALRKRILFHFTPMLDPDGCAQGRVRFNSLGFDVNRHWDLVSPQNPRWLSQLPEVWHAKNAIVFSHSQNLPIDLLVNMHNTETAEYIETCIDEEAASAPLIRLFEGLCARTDFAPSHPRINFVPTSGGTANDLWISHRIPIALMELRISASPKTGRFPTTEDRLRFGAALLQEMARAVEGP